MLKVHEYEDGYLLEGDGLSEEFLRFVKEKIGKVHFINIDPPYGNIVNEDWDRTAMSQKEFCDWMLRFTKDLGEVLEKDSALHIWGGIGIPKFRPFMEYASRIEAETSFTISNLITWSKRRAYGVQNNYLFTREECLFLTNGDKTHPRVFNVPLLKEKRGYAGFSAKYPAKSEFKRRTNVWTDVTELFRGKIHPTQKPTELLEISVQAHTNPGEWVLDCFAGSGSVALAARRNGRKFVVCEKSPEYSKTLLQTLGAPQSTFEFGQAPLNFDRVLLDGAARVRVRRALMPSSEIIFLQKTPELELELWKQLLIRYRDDSDADSGIITDTDETARQLQHSIAEVADSLSLQKQMSGVDVVGDVLSKGHHRPTKFHIIYDPTPEQYNEILVAVRPCIPNDENLIVVTSLPESKFRQ